MMWLSSTRLLALAWVVGLASVAARLPDEELEALSVVANTLGKRDWIGLNDNPCTNQPRWWNFTNGDDDTISGVNCTCNTTVNTTTCHVTHLYLKRQNLNGSLPRELAGLPFLQVIDLTRNYLSGTIPPEWGSMQSLRIISLQGNRVTGQIPKELANITLLEQLILEANQFNGTIPPEFGDFSRKCHWVKWETLSKAKQDGGLGLREMHEFNLAMLAKQFWRLLNNPNSNIHMLLKAKYFPNDSIWTTNLKQQSSYLWRSLMTSRNLIQAGTSWRVGDGRHIKIWDDAWIGVKNPSKPIQTINGRDQVTLVSDLIDEQTTEWKKEMVYDLFSSEDANQIMSIPLSHQKPTDRRRWRLTKSGEFSVRTAYHLAVKNSSKQSGMKASPSILPKEWTKMWQVKIIPRVKIFIWRACLRSLPTKENLAKRGFLEDTICILCGETTETIDHLMIKCRVTKKIWYWSPLRINADTYPIASFKELYWNQLSNPHPEVAELMAYIAYEIWNARNKVIFDNENFDPCKIIRKAHNIWMEGCPVKAKKIDDLSLIKPTRWIPPNEMSMKLNTDVAVFKNGQVGLGFVLRNKLGMVEMAGKMTCETMGGSTLLEGLAIRYALRMLQPHKWPDILVESDSKNLVDGINGQVDKEAYCDVIISDIKDLASMVNVVSFNYVPRNCNKLAHNIARGPDFWCFGTVPTHILSSIAADV